MQPVAGKGVAVRTLTQTRRGSAGSCGATCRALQSPGAVSGRAPNALADESTERVPRPAAGRAFAVILTVPAIDSSF